MIEQTTFLGLPLRTQRQRRLLVVLYYLLLLAIACASLRLGVKGVGSFISLSLPLAGLLGGVRMGGPVKAYRDLSGPPPLQSLNIDQRKPFGSFVPLDERERTQLNLARATAYRILILTLAVFFFAYWTPFRFNRVTSWLANSPPILSWILLVYAMSLPQSVLLWTEPYAPTADILEITSSSSAAR